MWKIKKDEGNNDPVRPTQPPQLHEQLEVTVGVKDPNDAPCQTPVEPQILVEAESNIPTAIIIEKTDKAVISKENPPVHPCNEEQRYVTSVRCLLRH